MLGSAQILLSYNGQNLLYSGDFALESQSTCTALECPAEEIDLLICESTCGEKENHPTAEDEVRAHNDGRAQGMLAASIDVALNRCSSTP